MIKMYFECALCYTITDIIHANLELLYTNGHIIDWELRFQAINTKYKHGRIKSNLL